MPAAGVVPVLSTERYPVEGSTVSEISRSLRAQAQQTRGFSGYHTSTLRYTYRLQDSGGRCRFTDVRIEVVSHTRVPEWRRPSDAPAELVAQWDAFVTALDDHERSHQQIAFDIAGQLARRLRELTEMSCSQLRSEGDREASRLMALHRERQRQFDADTQHGATTGTTWPPRPAAAREP